MTPTSINLVDASSDGGSSGGGFNGGCALKKGPWTAEEDAILVDYVKKHGEGNWNAVQRNSGLARCGKSCRLRWANHLRPNLKKGAFSPDEERLIVELHAKYGNKWARMASLLPGRTDNEIKNYWNTRVKRHQRQGLPLYPPDLQPQHQPPHHHYYHHHQQSSHSTPTTPTSSFSFQTHLSSPTTPTSHPYHSHHHQQLSPTTPPPLSPLPSPHSIASNSFTFQTQMPSPSHHHPHHLVASSAPILPLSSPSTNANNGFSTLALFDFSAPRAPPVLQTPLRFKRFSSAPASIVNASNSNVSMTSPTSFSLPLSPLTSPNGSHIGGGSTGGFARLLSTSNSEFHKNLQEENEKMCSLFAAVTQPSQELPSSQMMPNSSPMNSMGIGIGSKLIGRRLNKKKNGFISKDRQGNHGISMAKNGLLEDLLRDAKVFGVNGNGGQSSRDQNGLLLQDQNNDKEFDFDGFGSNWDNANSLSLSSGLEGKVEATSQTNTHTSEDYTKLLDTMPSTMPVEFNDCGEISNGQSSVITVDNIGFDMQQIASMFPTTTDHDRNLGTCSWDNLPRIC